MASVGNTKRKTTRKRNIISFQATTELRRILADAGKRYGMTASEVIRIAIYKLENAR